VRFVASDLPETFGVCHCQYCRRWTGSAFFEVSIPEDKVEWQGEIATYASSPIAERAFCPVCGTSLYFRMTEDNAFSGSYNIPLGLFDDPAAFKMSHEIWIDEATIGLADTGQARLTRADCVAKFPGIEDL
jgi:hypothetical protein